MAGLLVVAAVAAGVLFPAAARARAQASTRPLAEKDVNLDHALRLASLLRAAGVQADLTRDDDVFVPLRDRTALAAAAGADAFVSVHANGSPSGAVRGTEVYAQVRRPDSVALAQALLDGVTGGAGTVRRGVFQRPGRDGDYYAVLRTAPMPAVIVEVAYLSNLDDARALASPAFRGRVASGMAAGITAWMADRGAARGPAVAPPQRSPVPILQPPGSLTVASSGRDVTVRWQAVPGATAYRVWRDGNPIADVDAAAPGGATLVVDGPVPGGRHRYEVRALLEAGSRVLDESPSAVAEVAVPWLVVIDPGHGGRDPGAVGRV